MIAAVAPRSVRLARAAVAVGLAIGLGTAVGVGLDNPVWPVAVYADPITDPTPAFSPSSEPSPAPSPSPTPLPPPFLPPPQLGVRLAASEVRLGADYWRGTGGFADLVITAENTSSVDERIEIVYTTPVGVSDTRSGWSGQGCVELAVRMYRCIRSTVAPGARWTLRLRLRVESDAWRRAPLFGSVTATAVTPSLPTVRSAQDQREFQIVFPSGPAIPGLALWVGDVVLASPAVSTATLTVRIGNYGNISAIGRLDVAVPDGVTITTVPPGCASHLRLDARRLHCELGRLGYGRAEVLRFGLSLTLAAGQVAPLAGSVRAYLRPPRGLTAEAVATFRIVVTAVTSPSPSPPGGVDGGEGRQRAEYVPGGAAGSTVAEYLPSIPAVPLVLAIGAAFTALWLLVMVSLRRRLRRSSPR